MAKNNEMITLNVGDKAPVFKGTDQNGSKVSLADFKGKKVALYFYPADSTPTCTVQACNLRDNYLLLKQRGIEVIGVSPDDATSHKKFETKHQLTFTLLTDTKHTIVNQYGVWGEKQMFGNHYMGVYRTTFLIDEKGKIKAIFKKPKTKAHAEEIVEAALTPNPSPRVEKGDAKKK